MIPYEELVVALQAWRAKQGLPISQMSGMIAPPPQQQAAAPPPAAPRTNPPAPPRAQEAASDVEVDDAALLEESVYENEGEDFAMSFGGQQGNDDATAIGGAPKPGDSYGGTDPGVGPANAGKGGGGRGGGRGNW